MSIQHWKKKYQTKCPIAMLTAHDATMASLLEASGIDGILVGDSLRHTFYGDTTTVTATMDHMVYHTKAVKNGAKKTLIITDMPFMSYSIGIETTLKNATELIQAGANAVKCEVRPFQLPVIERLITEGIPVMGHIGLQPQYINESGGYALKGASTSEQKQLVQLAMQLSDIGVFAIVLEKIPIMVSKEITASVHCPTIGIGAGPHCSGQVLVTNDMLGLTPNFSPRFVKKYINGHHQFVTAFSAFKSDIESGGFPTNAHGYDHETF
jgi:3-methyl-2-oxobutanoate hydroxymethyltransferase